MTCEETIELMSASIDGMLEPAEQERLDAHLASCANCRAEMEQLRRAVSLLQEVEPVDVPPGLEARIVKAVREPAKRPLSWNVLSFPQVRVALAAGIVVVLSIFVMQTMKPPLVESPPRHVSDGNDGRAEEMEEGSDTEAPPPADDDAAAFEPSPPSVEEERRSGGFLQRERAPLAEPRVDTPGRADLESVARKKRSDAIWQKESPSVREGLRVGQATPQPAAAPAAADTMRNREAREEMERGLSDGIPAKRVPAPEEEMAEHKAKAARGHELREEVAADNETTKGAFAQANDDYRLRAAPADTTDAMRQVDRKDLHVGRQNAAFAFTVTGIDEERALVLLAAAPGEKTRDRGVLLEAARSFRDEESDTVTRPVVTRLADGRISIVAMVQSVNLPRLLTALGREGTVKRTGRQDSPAKGEGVIRIELVLLP